MKNVKNQIISANTHIINKKLYMSVFYYCFEYLAKKHSF